MNRLLLLVLFAGGCASSAPDGDQPRESAAELGDAWCHANLSSSAGTQMVFDYQVAKDNTRGDYTYASNVWLNVAGPALQPSDTVSAVVLSYTYNAVDGSSGEAEATLDDNDSLLLRYESGRFTAPVGTLPIELIPEGADGSSEPVWFWELAVADNGTWYKDPATGNNLRFEVGDLEGNCARGHSL